MALVKLELYVIEKGSPQCPRPSVSTSRATVKIQREQTHGKRVIRNSESTASKVKEEEELQRVYMPAGSAVHDLRLRSI